MSIVVITGRAGTTYRNGPKGELEAERESKISDCIYDYK